MALRNVPFGGDLLASETTHAESFSSTIGQISNSNFRPSDNIVTTTARYVNTNFEQVIDEEFFDELNKKMAKSMLPTLIYISLLMILGVVGNTMVFLVYYQRFKPSATRTYILVMSVFDLLGNVMSLPGEILDIRFSFTFDLPWLCRIVRSLNSFLTLVSAFVLVAVARDRYCKICRPLQKQATPHQIAVSVAVCTGVAVALTIPFAVLNGRHTITTGVVNVTGVTCSIDDSFVSTPFPMAYNALMALAFVSCVTTMVVSYVGVGRQLWQHRKRSKNVTGQANLKPSGSTSAPGGWRKASSTLDTTSSSKNESASSELPLSSVHFEEIPLDALPAGSQRSPQQRRRAHFVPCFPQAEVQLLIVHGTDRKLLPSDANTSENCDASVAAENKSTISVQSQKTSSSFSQADRKQRKQRSKAGSVKKIPKSTTMMMFVLTAVFIVNYLPHLLLIIARAVSDDVGKGLEGWELNIYNIALRSYFVNCAVNPLVYSFCSARFRQECRSLVTGKGK